MQHTRLYHEISKAIFDPASAQGVKGEHRTLTAWQTDAVLDRLRSFYPNIDMAYEIFLGRRNQDEPMPCDEHINSLRAIVTNNTMTDNLREKLLSSIDELNSTMADAFTYKNAMLTTALNIQSAITNLLSTNDVFIDTKSETEEGSNELVAWPVLSVHVWSYGRDSEVVPPEQVLFLSDLVKTFGPEALQAWVCHQRGLHAPRKGELSKLGIEALEYLYGLPVQNADCD